MPSACGLEASAIPKIFISYRRGDSASASGRIYDRLVAAFGRDNVFKDVDNIPPGVYFGSYIQESLRQCAVALVIIGPRWLDAQSGGGRRLDDPQDWVRLEIETAFALGLRVIPLLVEGAEVPQAKDLPGSLRNLARIQTSTVRDDPDFTHDMERVIAAIQQPVVAPLIAPSPPLSAPSPSNERGASSSWTPPPTSPPAPTANPVSSLTALPAVPPVLAPAPGKAKRASARRRRVLQLAAVGEAVVMVIAVVFVSLTYRMYISPWSVASSPTGQTLLSVAMVSATEGWAVGDNGTILHYSGGQWSAVTSPTNQDLYGVAMVSASEGWAVGDSGTILHYNDGQWSPVASVGISALLSVAMVSASEGWAVGIGGTILHYVGGQWSTATSPTEGILDQVAMVSASEGWIVGTDGTILHYVGGQWSTVISPTRANLLSVAMVSASDGWAVGVGGTILHYVGGQWSTAASPTSHSLFPVAMASATEGWAFGDGSTILHYSGGQWSTVTSPTDILVYSVAMVSSTDGWAVGEGGILRYTGGA